MGCSRNMKKNIKLIIICAVVVAVLAGLLVFLMLTKPQEEEQESEKEEILSTLLYEKPRNDLEFLTIENEHGTYEVERVTAGDNSVWTVMEIANLPLSSGTMATLLDNAASVTAQETVVENPEDISIYGLDKPSAVVTAKFSDSDSTVKKLIIGNETPKGNTRYFMLEGDPKVYTVYATNLNCYLNDKWNLVNKTVFTSAVATSTEDTTDYTRINKMTISRPDIDYDIVIEYDVRLDVEDNMVANSSTYVLTSPVFRELNPETSAEVTDGVFGLTAADLGICNPNEEDLVNCGITEPAVTLDVEVNGGKTLKLFIGNEYINEEGKKAGRYVYVDGIDIIYIFDESTLPWIDVMPLEIVTTMFTSNYIYTLTGMDITCEGHNLSFTVTGSSADDFAVKLNGTDADTDAFKDLYQFVLRAPSSELCFEETTAEPALTIDIKTADGGDLIEFIPSDNRQTIIRLNGKSAYKCATAYVDRFISNLDLYENGEPIITNW